MARQRKAAAQGDTGVSATQEITSSPNPAKVVPTSSTQAGAARRLERFQAAQAAKAERKVERQRRHEKKRKARKDKRHYHRRKHPGRWEKRLADNPEALQLIGTEAIVSRAQPEGAAQRAKQRLIAVSKRFRTLPPQVLVRQVLKARQRLVQAAPDVVELLLDAIQQSHAQGDFKTAAAQALAVLELVSQRDAAGHVERVIPADESKGGAPLQVAIGVNLGGRNELPPAPSTTVVEGETLPDVEPAHE